MYSQSKEKEQSTNTEHPTPKKSIVLDVQSVRHVINVNTNQQKKENRENG